MGAEERDGSLRFFEPADKTIVPHCLYSKTSGFALIDAGQRRNSSRGEGIFFTEQKKRSFALGLGKPLVA